MRGVPKGKVITKTTGGSSERNEEIEPKRKHGKAHCALGVVINVVGYGMRPVWILSLKTGSMRV